MPIEVGREVRVLSEEEFLRIAYAVTGVAFALHKEYGSLFAEKLYKVEMAAECRKLGLPPVEFELPIVVSRHDFRKDYFADLLVGGGALIELKALAALTEEHRAQTLHYLFLTGLNRAKLINLGGASVQHEFVSTTLTPAQRRCLNVQADRWHATGEASLRFHELLRELLADWGGFLQLPLYYDAVSHFFGGPDRVIQDIPVVRDGHPVTTQRVHLLDPTTAFKLTALGSGLDTLEQHLHRFLRHTQLDAIHWVNLHHHDVTFTTLIRTK
ncbi:MAG: GxxExxY protein [Pirellulaceae bacterium]|nr:GxxExxY protein [Pirellulaceae bacterium]